MDKHQAEVVAETLLESARQNQLEVLHATEATRLRRSEKQQRMTYAGIGVVIGGLTAYFLGGPVVLSCAVGGGIGSLVGLVVLRAVRIRNA